MLGNLVILEHGFVVFGLTHLYNLTQPTPFCILDYITFNSLLNTKSCLLPSCFSSAFSNVRLIQTCNGVIMIGSVGEGLQEISLVLESVVDLSFKVLKSGDEMVESPFGIGMVQQAAGRDLEPAVAQVQSQCVWALHICI